MEEILCSYSDYGYENYTIEDYKEYCREYEIEFKESNFDEWCNETWDIELAKKYFTVNPRTSGVGNHICTKYIKGKGL